MKKQDAQKNKLFKTALHVAKFNHQSTEQSKQNQKRTLKTQKQMRKRFLEDILSVLKEKMHTHRKY
jgi:small-conductance mechanosensitive channel